MSFGNAGITALLLMLMTEKPTCECFLFKTKQNRTEQKLKQTNKKSSTKKNNFAAALLGYFWWNPFLLKQHDPFSFHGVSQAWWGNCIWLQGNVFVLVFVNMICLLAFLSNAANASNLFLFSREPESAVWQAVLYLPFEMSHGRFKHSSAISAWECWQKKKGQQHEPPAHLRSALKCQSLILLSWKRLKCCWAWASWPRVKIHTSFHTIIKS